LRGVKPRVVEQAIVVEIDHDAFACVDARESHDALAEMNLSSRPVLTPPTATSAPEATVASPVLVDQACEVKLCGSRTGIAGLRELGMRGQVPQADQKRCRKPGKVAGPSAV
jgi:hypothetical protein